MVRSSTVILIRLDALRSSKIHIFIYRENAFTNIMKMHLKTQIKRFSTSKSTQELIE